MNNTMTFDMRNWHLVGGVQSTGAERKLPKVDAESNIDEYVRFKGVVMEPSDPTCMTCGFVECECNPCRFQMEYEAVFPQIVDIKLADMFRRGVPAMQDGRRIGIAMSDSDEDGIVTVALDNKAV